MTEEELNEICPTLGGPCPHTEKQATLRAIRLIQDLRRLGLFFSAVFMILLIGIALLVQQNENSRNRTIKKINQEIAVIQGFQAQTEQAAILAKAAAQKASMDLATAIASSRSSVPNSQLQKAYAEIQCIAHGQVPKCP